MRFPDEAMKIGYCDYYAMRHTNRFEGTDKSADWEAGFYEAYLEQRRDYLSIGEGVYVFFGLEELA